VLSQLKAVGIKSGGRSRRLRSWGKNATIRGSRVLGQLVEKNLQRVQVPSDLLPISFLPS